MEPRLLVEVWRQSARDFTDPRAHSNGRRYNLDELHYAAYLHLNPLERRNFLRVFPKGRINNQCPPTFKLAEAMVNRVV